MTGLCKYAAIPLFFATLIIGPRAPAILAGAAVRDPNSKSSLMDGWADRWTEGSMDR